MDGHRIREPITDQLPRRLTRQLLALCRTQLTRKGDLELRIRAAFGTLVSVRSLTKRMRVGLGALRHVAALDRLHAAALLRAVNITEQKKRGSHAKILIGVAMIQQGHTSEASASKFSAMLDQFYADSPERLKATQFGLTVTVKKPASDLEQD